MKELSDLAEPAVIEHKPLLEAEVQKQCVDWVRARGYWARKFSSLSQRSVPDYLFSKRFAGRCAWMDEPTDVKFFTEFKREKCPIDKKTGLMSTEAQVEEQELMRAAGWFGFECSSFEYFKQRVEVYERGILLC